ncbi:MAG: hypothetical protein ABW061_04530 [Polyangiaceae bacterium]
MSGAHQVGPFGMTWMQLAISMLSSIDPHVVRSIQPSELANWLAKVEAHPEYSLEPGENQFAVIAVEVGYLQWMHGPEQHDDVRQLPLSDRVRLSLVAVQFEAGISVVRPEQGVVRLA